MRLAHLPDAAHQLGVSYPTLKQWIYRGKIRSIKTPGGHHRIPQVEINRLLFRKGSSAASRAKGTPAAPRARSSSATRPGTGLEAFISGRNQLLGRIIKIQTIGLLSKVSLDIGWQTVTAIITRDAVRELGLKVDEPAAALIKATEVMIIRPAAPGWKEKFSS